ncbi:MFS transporter [Thermoplasma sp.]|uniref:MFS transporter n=1 Tax=Thermoplasma sp. TaxID=1973142 RepID=UPI001270906E|nr:MFS transporter [Thermoplasma sp.]KAA8921921.1 MAG: MFS transporter [Thermoplasma sp.]
MVSEAKSIAFLRRFLKGSGNTEQRVMDLSIGDGALWSIYSSITSPYIVPLAILLIGSSAPVGFITGIPVIAVPFSQIAAYRILRRFDDLKSITIVTTFLDRLPWLIIALLIFVHTPYFFYILLALLLMRSFFSSFSGTTWTLWIPGMISERNRDGYFSTRNMVMKAFGIVGYLIAISVFIAVNGYRLDYFIIFVVSFIFSALSINIMRNIPAAKVRDVYSTSSTGSTETEFVLAVLLISLIGFGYYFSQPYITLYLLGKPYLNLGSTIYTAVLIFSGIIYIGSQRLGKVLSLKAGYKITIVIAALLLIVLFTTLYISHASASVVLIVILMSIPVSIYSLASFNMAVSRSSGENRVRRTSYYTISNSIALSAGPIAGNIVYNTIHNLHLMFLISAVILLATVPVSFYIGRFDTTRSIRSP